jgi:predicted nucleic acid binding AN1-type Zn finger protein
VQIVDKLAFEPIAKTGEASILHQFNVTRGKMDFCRQHDSYQVANELFWRTWEDLNHSFKMNSSNLSFLVEMMISQIFWMMGEHNETWAAYFQGIQIKCGNGHYRITTKDGTVNDQRKPNSSGMDWTHARVTQLFQVILDRFGCADSKHNLQTPVNCLSWTPASIPLLTNATICDGKIDTLPDPMVCLRSVIATEVRDVAIGPMIGNFPRNSEGTEQLKFNTCDPDNTNKRKPRVQVKVSPLQVVALSTNVSASSVKEDEQYNTLSAVIAVSNNYFVFMLNMF